jgi:predicted amidohydrolase
MAVLKVSVAQLGAVYGNSELTVKSIVKSLSEATASGSKLIVFPEATLGGYPKYADFGATVGDRQLDGREAFKEVCDPLHFDRNVRSFSSAWCLLTVVGLVLCGSYRSPGPRNIRA